MSAPQRLADAVALADRVMSCSAGAVIAPSRDQVLDMAAAIVVLADIADAAADLVAAQTRRLALPEVWLSPEVADEADRADSAIRAAARRLVKGLQDIGSLTAVNKDLPHGQN